MKLPINQIIHGNCLKVMKDWPDKCVDLVLTDPPYGLDKLWVGGTWFTKNVYAKDKVKWDKKVSDEYIKKVIMIGQNTIIWGGNYYTILPVGRCWLSWSKINSMPTMSDFELAWTTFDKPSKEYRSLRNDWERQHPTEKPLGLMLWCLENYSKEDDLIVDPFCGSGTTCVAAKMLGRRFIGIDIKSRYCKIANMRLEETETGISIKKQKQGFKGLLDI